LLAGEPSKALFVKLRLQLERARERFDYGSCSYNAFSLSYVEAGSPLQQMTYELWMQKINTDGKLFARRSLLLIL
jgi:hypothetical protein